LPCLNEERHIVPFYEETKKVFEESLNGYDFELIYVDDGSRDDSLSLVKKLGDEDKRVKCISFSRNFGHQAALTAGLKNASGVAAITMDCDFQHPPQLIPEMVRKWEDGNKIVYGRRKNHQNSFFKRVSSRAYYKILGQVSDVKFPKQVGDFRLVDRVVLNYLTRMEEHGRYLRGMVAWLGFQHDFLDYDEPARRFGETRYTMVKMVKLAMDGLLHYSFFPLKMGLWVGLFSMFLSGVFILYMGWDFFINHTPYPLYKWLIVMLFAFVGAQFIALWIIGEYISRIYNDVRKRPLYVIDESVNLEIDSGV